MNGSRNEICIASCQVERKRDGCLLSLSLELFSYDEVAIIVEDKLVREGIEE